MPRYDFYKEAILICIDYEGTCRKYSRSDLEDLRYLRNLVAQCKTAPTNQRQHIFNNIRACLADMASHENVSDNLTSASKILDVGGLPDIVGRREVNYHHDLQSDAQALLNKWTAGNYDPDMFRGVDTKNPPARGKISRARSLGWDSLLG